MLLLFYTKVIIRNLDIDNRRTGLYSEISEYANDQRRPIMGDWPVIIR